MTTITVSSKYQIVLPKAAREAMQIRPGMRLQVSHDERGGLRLVKEPTLEEMRGLLKGLEWKLSDVRDETDRDVS
jgi:AbrB family looped-hinge helix DNA binding protein